MATGLTLQDKPSVIITDSGLGRSRHTGTVATEVGHTKLIHYVRLCFTHKEQNMHIFGSRFEVGNCIRYLIFILIKVSYQQPTDLTDSYSCICISTLAYTAQARCRVSRHGNGT